MRVTHKRWLLAGVAVVGVVTAAGLTLRAPATGADANDLLDPRYVAMNGCGGIATGRNELFKPGVRLALARAAAAMPTAEVPLYDGLGGVSMVVSTTSADAQRYFDQGLQLATGFNHAEALRSFRAAQDADPACAMCYWGEAWVLGPNINLAMDDDNQRPAFAAAAQATVLATDASDLERGLVAAMAKRYTVGDDVDRVALDLAYADAMVALAAAHPNEPTVQALAAEALMNTQPWDYWEADKRTPKGRADEIVVLLEGALALDPNHPAASHLYIHAVEASATPERAEPYADRLGGAMPAAGHLVHMPSHIYYRIGRYLDSLDANRAAVAADERFLSQVADDGIYRYGYYPHNVHYLLVSAQKAGAVDDALAAAAKLADVMSDDLAAEVAWIQAIKTAPYTVHAQFSDPATILALPEAGERFPFVAGIRNYARGIALVRSGDLSSAKMERDAIAGILETHDFADMEAQYVPARTLLAIAQNVLDARLHAAVGEHDAAVALLEDAAAMQDTVPYMEPPYWYYPVRQTLGAVLFEAGDYDAAIDAYKASLMDEPNNAWTLWGLKEAMTAKGDHAGAAATAALLDKAWVGDDALLEHARL